MYLTARRALGLKLESSAYSQPQADLQAADYNLRAYNIKYSTEIQEAKRLYSVGDFSAFSSIMGKRAATISFSMDMVYSGAVATEPDWGKVLKACGFKETAHTTTGISWTPNAAYSNVPCVVEVAELEEGSSSPKQLTIQMRAAMGTVKFILDTVGAPMRMDFEFKGPLQTIEDRASPITPTGWQTTTPTAVLGATITAFSEALDLEKITLDAGNKVELFVDPSTPEGYHGAHIVGRDPRLTVDPYLASLATRSHWSRLTGGTTGALAIAVGTSLAISAPAIQIVKAFDGGDRGGAAINTLECILTRSSGNDEFEILQGAKA